MISVYQKFQHFVLSNFGRILHAQIKNFPLAVIFKSPALPPTCSSKESQTFPVAGKLAALLRVTKAAVPGIAAIRQVQANTCAAGYSQRNFQQCLKLYSDFSKESDIRFWASFYFLNLIIWLKFV